MIATQRDYEADKEHLVAILLNTKMVPLGFHEVSRGSLNESIAHPREIFRPAIIAGAYGIILAHNHPSGNPLPSDADKRLTKRIHEAADLLRIQLYDHLIIGEETAEHAPFFSFREGGIL